MKQTIPDYIAITAVLEKLDTEVTPSEAHGTITGLLCAETGANAELWQQNLWPQATHDSGDLLIAEALKSLTQLHDITRLQLNDPSCEFQLLLPVDDDHIENRVNALGDWCQAFLVGLALGGVNDFAPLPDNAREVTNDLVEIARAGTSYSLEGSEEDENAYAELVEYIRVGVLLINEEIQPSQAAQQPESTLH